MGESEQWTRMQCHVNKTVLLFFHITEKKRCIVTSNVKNSIPSAVNAQGRYGQRVCIDRAGRSADTGLTAEFRGLSTDIIEESAICPMPQQPLTVRTQL